MKCPKCNQDMLLLGKDIRTRFYEKDIKLREFEVVEYFCEICKHMVVYEIQEIKWVSNNKQS